VQHGLDLFGGEFFVVVDGFEPGFFWQCGDDAIGDFLGFAFLHEDFRRAPRKSRHLSGARYREYRGARR
jgi:hypothetical protein